MKQPQSSHARQDDKVSLEEEFLNGLQQSGRKKNLTLDSLLKVQGITRLKADLCVHVSQEKELEEAFVDDLLIITKDETEIVNFKSRLGQEPDSKDLGEASHILSTQVKEMGSCLLVGLFTPKIFWRRLARPMRDQHPLHYI